MKIMRAVRCLCAALCLIGVFVLPAAAEDFADTDIYMIESFDTSVGAFRAGKNIQKTAAEKMTDGDGAHERACLRAVGSYAALGELRGVHAKFSAPVELGDYRSVMYDIYVPLCEEDPDAVYYSRITLFSSDGSSTESLVDITGGEWCRVEADISKWSGRDEVVSIEIAAVVDTANLKYSADGFYVDDIYACDKVDYAVSSRFLFDKYELNGAAGAMNDDGVLLISASSFEQFSLSADVFAPELLYDANSLRIKIANSTMSDILTVCYTTSDSQANSEDKTVTVPIKPMSGPSYYYAYVGDVSMLRSMELRFNDGGGNVEIYSISAVTLPKAEEYESCGSVSICRLSDDRSTVSFYGEIDRDTVLNNQDGKISVYIYEPDTLPTAEELLLLEPVVSGEMTTRFELIWKLPEDNPYACYSRFIAVVTDTDGNYKLISPPFYIDNPGGGRLSDKSAFAADVKGLAADDISVIGETDSGLTVLCADIRLAFSSPSEGVPFSYNKGTYYINKEYTEQLSKKITVLNRSGVSVLLRCIGWERSSVEALATLYSAGSVDGEFTGYDFTGAFASYIADTWCADGSVAGVILGERENIIPNGVSVSDMISYTAKELSKMYFNVTSRNSGARVYISVTDLMDVELSTNASELPLNDYFTALSFETEQYGNYGWEIAVEIGERAEDSTSGTVNLSNCTPLTELLSTLEWDSKNIIFCDSTYEESGARMSALTKQYVIGYYSAYFNDRVDAYIAIAGNRAAAIAEAVKCIDTTEADVIISSAFMTLESDGIADIVKGYDESKLMHRSLAYSDAFNEAPDGIKGSYSYLVFNSASNINEMTPGYYCEDMHIVRDDVQALSAQLNSALYNDSLRASWMGVSHRFKDAESFENTPIIALTLKLQNVAPTGLSGVPVKLVLHSDNGRFESSGRVYSDEWTTVYFDIEDFDGIEDVTSLQILAGDGKLESASLLIKDIKGLSYDYDDDSLAEVIAKEQLRKRTPDDDTVTGETYLWMGGAVLLGVITVVIVALLSRKKGDYRE